MWRPPEYAYDGLALRRSLPRNSSPPPRSTRSQLPGQTAKRLDRGAALPRSCFRPCLIQARASPRRGATASECLAQELRPSTPPLRSRSYLQHTPRAVCQDLPLRHSPLDSSAWEITPSSVGSAGSAHSGASTACGTPPKVCQTIATPPVQVPSEPAAGSCCKAQLHFQDDPCLPAPVAPLEVPARSNGSVQFRSMVSFYSQNSGDAFEAAAQTQSAAPDEACKPNRSHAATFDSDITEAHEGKRSSVLSCASTKAPSVRERRRSSIGKIGGGLSRLSNRRSSVAVRDVLEALEAPGTKSIDEDPAPEAEKEEEAEETSSEGEEPSSFLDQRRGGVSAEAHGTWNQFSSTWHTPSEPKTQQQRADLMKALRKCPFTQKVDVGTLDGLVSAMPVQQFPPGALVCRQGDSGDCAFILLQGTVSVFKEDADRVFVRSLPEGRVFGEFSMLWSTPRTRSVYVDEAEEAVLAILSREVFQNLVVRSVMRERSRREDCLRRSAMLETLSDEQIAQLADALEKKCYAPSEDIVRQGEEGDELYVILEGTCVVTVKTGTAEDVDIQEYRRCHAGDMFGEKALLEKTQRSATVTAVTQVEVLALRRAAFERMLGPLSQLQDMHYLCDPRRSIASFYQPGDQSGPAGVCQGGGNGETTEWFAVYRPTSRDAIAKMLSSVAVGKGLNVKGKSAKLNRLSGFVPFLQISQEKDKGEIEESPPEARASIFFGSAELRQSARLQLQTFLEREALDIQDRRIVNLDSYASPGLDLPEPLLRYAFIQKPDIQPAVGWETGRISSPAFMDMNLQALRGGSKPNVVLYQYDQDNAMNPHGLLIAYAEATVKPVVSDFDTFTVGSTNMRYSALASEQAQLALWALDHTEGLLKRPSPSSWTTRWLEVLKQAHEQGFHPDVPEYGFGDATSYRLIEGIVHATQDSGAVRHGAECFNFYFPQELDENFLVVWEGFDDKPWMYMDEDELRDFLVERVEEGYAMPLNPIWCVRDPGWFDVLQAQMESPFCKAALEAWYPPQSGILEKVQALHEEFPDGLELASRSEVPQLQRSFSTCPDLDTLERATLASSIATAKSSRWSAALRKVNLMQSISRASIATSV
ncbi:unnamed protein product [Effrenium voratum]|uniref:Cyclic nucleotide-binding domain-containing protein n=1 Tax=Effrenium voratum TaxID=2562239 RepID=A0AA36II22_9DINO|nr:unnamed protein product [Effrenium voratum]|mmetsp:Transcript_121453/g.288604  ORF Transcript_121453/g.288604 Transcript_121453/m.288604 type:complete len:1099 (+) Transcript_121453:95-3391(+)